jgi:hypothetical protein
MIQTAKTIYRETRVWQTLFPNGRVFCQITPGPKKIIFSRKKLEAVNLSKLSESGRKKIIYNSEEDKLILL